MKRTFCKKKTRLSCATCSPPTVTHAKLRDDPVLSSGIACSFAVPLPCLSNRLPKMIQVLFDLLSTNPTGSPDQDGSRWPRTSVLLNRGIWEAVSIRSEERRVGE